MQKMETQLQTKDSWATPEPPRYIMNYAIKHKHKKENKRREREREVNCVHPEAAGIDLRNWNFNKN